MFIVLFLFDCLFACMLNIPYVEVIHSMLIFLITENILIFFEEVSYLMFAVGHFWAIYVHLHKYVCIWDKVFTQKSFSILYRKKKNREVCLRQIIPDPDRSSIPQNSTYETDFPDQSTYYMNSHKSEQWNLWKRFSNCGCESINLLILKVFLYFQCIAF